ncbi:hypothetical protein FB451DRAFT_1419395 [Mycena latifolia]|nr:hypothetical protein FB451DRAFT_1419395 [Mycena latifolia]
MAAFAKLAFLLVGALFYDRSFVPPTPPPSVAEQVRTERKIGWYEALIGRPVLPYWIRTVHWAFTLTEAATILVVAEDPISISVPRLSLALLVGTSLIVVGASIRLRCFRELGRHFTFAMSVRDHHALITTGPYAVVRHPSYTGGNMTLVGAVLSLLTPKSWWWDGGRTTPWGVFLTANFSICAALFMYAFLRGAKEDRYLAKTFGEKWECYARDVPYRYIPGLC